MHDHNCPMFQKTFLQQRRALPRRAGFQKRSAPYPPSSNDTDQHAVVTISCTQYPCDFTGHELLCGGRTHWQTPLSATGERSFERNPTSPVGGLCSLRSHLITNCISSQPARSPNSAPEFVHRVRDNFSLARQHACAFQQHQLRRCTSLLNV